MDYERFVLQDVVSVRNLISMLYKETSSQHYFEGESHNYWEVLYMDKGEWEVTTDGRVFSLEQGDLLVFPPNVFHSGRALHGTSPNLLLISFDCDSPALEAFATMPKFRLSELEKSILSRLIKEGGEAFAPPIHSVHTRTLVPSKLARFGSGQWIKNDLELFLITLIRRMADASAMEATVSVQRKSRDTATVTRIIRYLERSLSSPVAIEEICKRFCIGRTALKTSFKHSTGCSVIEYVTRMRVEKAKTLICEDRHTYTEISVMLGFSSIHYFSKTFKRITRMTPTEYARSVQSVQLAAIRDRTYCYGFT